MSLRPKGSKNSLADDQKIFMELENSKDLEGLYTELKTLWRLVEAKTPRINERKQLLMMICSYSIDDIARQHQREHATPQPKIKLNLTSDDESPSRSLKILTNTLKITRTPKAKLVVLRNRHLDISKTDDLIMSEFSHNKTGGAFSKAKRMCFDFREKSPGPGAYNTSMELYRSSPMTIIPKSNYRRLDFIQPPSPGPAHYSPRRHYLSRF